MIGKAACFSPRNGAPVEARLEVQDPPPVALPDEDDARGYGHEGNDGPGVRGWEGRRRDQPAATAMEAATDLALEDRRGKEWPAPHRSIARHTSPRDGGVSEQVHAVRVPALDDGEGEFMCAFHSWHPFSYHASSHEWPTSSE